MGDRKPKPSWFERNPKKTIAAVVLAGIVLGLILAEGGARIFLPHWGPTRTERAYFWSYDERLGWVHRSNQRGRFSHPDFSVEVNINAQGQRDDEYSLSRTGKKRMLILGDSYSWGFGVEHDEIFCEILEHRYPDWEIINASVSGYSTDQEFIYLMDRGMQFNPDVVLLLFSQNDFINNVVDEQCWYYKPRFVLSGNQLALENVPVPKSTFTQKLDRFFFGKTYLLKRIYLKIKIIGIRLQSGGKTPAESAGGGKLTLTEEPQKEQYRHQLVKRLIEEMNNYTGERGARFVLVSVPLPEHQTAVLREVAAMEDVPYLPLNDAIDQAGGEITFANDDHWNARGHRVVADSVERFLLGEGIFN